MDEGIPLAAGVIGIIYLHYIPFHRLEFLLQESRKVHLAYEAYPLGILLVRGRQVGLLGDLANLRLGQSSDREKCLGKLLLGQLAEEIALVLVGIDALEYAPLWLAADDDLVAFRIQQRLTAAVMAGGDHVRTHPFRSLEEGVELDLPVAQDVRIGCAAMLIFIEHIVHDPLAIFLGKVHEIERNTYLPGYHLGHETVLLPLAVPVQGRIRIVPVLHEHRKHVIPLLLEQQGGDTGVDSSGKTYAYLHTDAKLINIKVFCTFFTKFGNWNNNTTTNEESNT